MRTSYQDWLLLLSLLSGSASAARTNERGQKFLEENRQKPDVVELPSGLQYKVLEKGNNYRVRDEESMMFVTYKCTGIEEEPFPIWGDDQINDLAPADVMEGWREPLMIMDEGAKWEVYIPPALATHVGADVTGDVLVCNLYVKKIAGPREYFGEQEDSGEEQEKQAGGGGGEEAEDEEEQKGNEDEDQEL